jgi:hypothetical protein
MSDRHEQIPERVLGAAKGYNAPAEPTAADLDTMWTRIEAEAFAGGAAPPSSRPSVRGGITAVRYWMPLAAALLLGVAIGRWSSTRPAAGAGPQLVAEGASADSVRLDEPYQSTTSQYLGQAAALLVSLPAEARDARASDPYMGRAHDLLLTTRLLLDSPAARDPRFRGLLEDLELVFAQLVRLQSASNSEDLELIRQALEQRDVLPRLRSAAANISAD